MSKLKRIIKIFTDWKLTLSGLLGAAMLIADLYLRSGLLSAAGFILVFNFFDLIGYRGMMIKIRIVDKDEYDELLPYYRIMQTMFQIVLLLLIGSTQGWLVAGMAELLHWTGNQDLLYYLVGGYKYPKGYTWLYWTPVGIFWPRSKPIPHWVIVLQAAVGIGIVINLFI